MECRISRYFFMMFLFVMLLIFSSRLFGDQGFSDIPPDHWAYKAVLDLYQKNVIKGFPASKKFMGKKPLSRYEMASLLSRLIDTLNENQQSALDEMSYKTMKQFEMLISEFHGDISRLREEVKEVREHVGKVDKKVIQLDSRVNLLEKHKAREQELRQEIRRVNRKSNNRLLMMLLISTGLAIKVF